MKAKYHDLNIVEMDLSGVKGLKGLCINQDIAIEKNLGQVEKSCVLAEELGHYFTSYGNILNQNDIMNRKQEYRARLYGYNLKIGLTGIISAYNTGCRNLYEMAEFLDVTEEYLKDAIECYRKKYGVFVAVDNYLIYFEPQLSVAKINSL
nr:MAG TPA: IrrE protein [Caudoviricetes sp.]